MRGANSNSQKWKEVERWTTENKWENRAAPFRSSFPASVGDSSGPAWKFRRSKTSLRVDRKTDEACNVLQVHEDPLSPSQWPGQVSDLGGVRPTYTTRVNLGLLGQLRHHPLGILVLPTIGRPCHNALATFFITQRRWSDERGSAVR